ncbi:MAG: alanine--tRNA ligase-related protein [Lachnospiraceae bacterium]|nr:alanine--tRNA ligase-related protein [Lachnospiraceae bacterium]
MTEKLFYKDSHLREFRGNVLQCEIDGDNYKVVLDRTAFFPEGGGQTADKGTIDEIEVLDVREQSETIYHVVKEPIEIGKEIVGSIEWKDRFSKMQQHTGEHIVSGIIHKKFGYDNIGFHLGSEEVTMDFNGTITKEQLQDIEYEANEAVFRNILVEVDCPDKEALISMNYRSKIEIEGQVRIVTISGCDVCACCAPHVHNTGEIGLIKLIDLQNYKKGVRISMVCGLRALQNYQIKEKNTKEISILLSAKEALIADAVIRLKEENAGMKIKLANLQQEIFKMKIAKIPNQHVVCLFEEILEGSGPRELVNMLMEKQVDIGAVFVGNEIDGFRYVIGSKTEDVRGFAKMFNEKFAGRGGGKQEMVQGSLIGTKEAITRCFE